MQRNELVYLQFKDATPNTVLGWNESGTPIHIGIFQPATSLLDGAFGLVPKPLAGQETYILSNNGWIIPPSGGGGSVNGTGVANRLTFWSATDTVSSKNVLTFDSTNDILKVPTINLARAAVPASGSTDGDIVFVTSFDEFYVKTNGQWISLTRQNEIVLGVGVTDYTLLESDRNCFIETTSSSPVTIRLPDLSMKFGATIVKGGAGNITISVTGGPALIATASIITTLRGAATVYRVNTPTNTWKAYGNLG